VDIDGDLDINGDIRSHGSIESDLFRFDDLSESSDNYIDMNAPYDLDHNFDIELFDSEPSFEDEGFVYVVGGDYPWPPLPEHRKRGKRRNRKGTEETLPSMKLSYFNIKAEYPLAKEVSYDPETLKKLVTLKYVGGGSDVSFDAQLVSDIVYGALTDLNGSFSGFSSLKREQDLKIKSSYVISTDDYSGSSLSLLNRQNNGFRLKSLTQGSISGTTPPTFSLQSLTNSVTTDLFSFNGTEFNLNNYSLNGLPAPTQPNHAVNKAYVDAHSGSGGTVTSVTAGAGLISTPSTGITTTGSLALAPLSPNPAGSFKNLNATINDKGQVTAASNGLVTSPLTLNRTIPVWGDLVGGTLLATPVTLDANGNIVSPGDATFADVNIDTSGFLTIKSTSSFSARFKAASSMSASYTMTLPTNNSAGFLKNNGGGTLSFSSLATSDLSDFSSAVTSFRLDQFVKPTANLDLNTRKVINLQTPTSSSDAATKGYVDSMIGGSSVFDGNIFVERDTSNSCYIALQKNSNGLTPVLDTAEAYLFVQNDGKLYFRSGTTTYYVAG
jgi:hypothetical protein